MPSAIDPKFKAPKDICSKIAFQYCLNPKKDLPTPEQMEKYQFIIVDDWFCYPDFQNYYGPSNLAHVIRFGEIIEELYSENEKIVCIRTSPASMQRSNVALLISTYLMIYCGWEIEKISDEMDAIFETVLEYRTEGEGDCDHHVSIHDCLRGLQIAFEHLPSLKLEEFDVEDLLWMEQPQNGDLNWIVPGQLLALAGPTEQNWSINKFIDYAKQHKIGAMVRLNRPHYPSSAVTENGDIEHIEMFMHDGTNPTEQNVRDFINLVDRMTEEGRAIAVHCRAGLGRTGTMIAAYLLFSYARDHESEKCLNCPCLSLTPQAITRAIIGFLRIMRPGSVLSGQPEFLESISEVVMRAGAANDPGLIESFSNNEVSFEISEEIEDIKVEVEEDYRNVSVVKIRVSKRLKASTSQGSLRIQKNKKQPISHAGRGHAAEKHSTVQLERI